MGRDTSDTQVYAVIRVDVYEPSRLMTPEHVRSALTVKEILPTLEEAEAEVERLNRLNGAKGCVYLWQMTRLYAARAQENY